MYMHDVEENRNREDFVCLIFWELSKCIEKKKFLWTSVAYRSEVLQTQGLWWRACPLSEEVPKTDGDEVPPRGDPSGSIPTQVWVGLVYGAEVK